MCSIEIRYAPWSTNEHNGSNGTAPSKRIIHSWPGAYVLTLACSLTCGLYLCYGVEGQQMKVLRRRERMNETSSYFCQKLWGQTRWLTVVPDSNDLSASSKADLISFIFPEGSWWINTALQKLSAEVWFWLRRLGKAMKGNSVRVWPWTTCSPGGERYEVIPGNSN